MGFTGRPSWSKGPETESRGKVRTSPDKTTNPYTVIRSMADIPTLCSVPVKPLPIYTHLVIPSPYSKVFQGFLITLGTKFKILSRTFEAVYDQVLNYHSVSFLATFHPAIMFHHIVVTSHTQYQVVNCHSTIFCLENTSAAFKSHQVPI